MTLAPFTAVQTNYIQASAYSWLNVLEGGKRGGKNVVNVMAWCAALEYHESKLHLAAGVSVATAKLNIIDCDGFGLLYYFYGRYREGKYKDRDCVYVQTKTGEKIILVSGGGKKGDEKLIKGNTYGTALITEINECHPDFIQEVFDRTLSSPDRKIFADFNPKQPKHWFYTDILNFHEQQQEATPEYGYNYAHTTIADNLSITDKQLRRILKSYDKKTVWYKRDIKGQRTAAEGLVFPMFANNPDKWLIDEPLRHYLRLFIGVDFGGSTSKTMLILAGICDGANGPEVHIIDEMHIKDLGLGVDANDIINGYVDFYTKKAFERFGIHPFVTYTDHEEALRLGMQKRVEQHSHKVVFVDKSQISLSSWCKYIAALFSRGMIRVVKWCKMVIASLSTLIYDPKATDDRPLDDREQTCDVDTYDGVRYAIIHPVKDWLRRGLLTGVKEAVA